jgi:hypothetical protein
MATSASLVQCLASGLVDSTGAAIASGKVRFYSPGTLSALTVYSDTAGSTAITQPLTLTAGGTGTVYARGLVRMIVKDALDSNTLLDVNINTYVSNGVNVEDYGAVGDGVTDCTTAITNAVAAAIASPSTRIVNFPSGTFVISSAIALSSNITFIGTGRATTIINQTSATANGISITSTPTVRLSSLAINAASSSGSAIASTAGATLLLEAFGIGGGSRFTTGISGTLQRLEASNACAIDAVTTGISLTVNTMTLVGMINLSGSTAAIDATASNKVTLLGGSIANLVRIRTGILQSYGTGIGSLQLDSGASAASINGVASQSVTTDSRVASPFVETLAGTTSVTPTPWKAPTMKIIQSGAAATTTINAPLGTYPRGTVMQITYVNTSGGALTWTHNAVFKISAAVAPATGNRIKVVFEYDPEDATWSEVSRSGTVPN